MYKGLLKFHLFCDHLCSLLRLLKVLYYLKTVSKAACFHHVNSKGVLTCCIDDILWGSDVNKHLTPSIHLSLSCTVCDADWNDASNCTASLYKERCALFIYIYFSYVHVGGDETDSRQISQVFVEWQDMFSIEKVWIFGIILTFGCRHIITFPRVYMS